MNIQYSIFMLKKSTSKIIGWLICSFLILASLIGASTQLSNTPMGVYTLVALLPALFIISISMFLIKRYLWTDDNKQHGSDIGIKQNSKKTLNYFAWAAFAWIAGSIFIVSGAISLFNPIYTEKDPAYNVTASMMAFIIGVVIIRSWMKNR